MFRTRTRKIISDIWTRKVRTLLTAASIFIGVFGVVSLTSAGEILVNQLEKDLQQDKLAMLKSNVVLNRDAQVNNADVLDTLRQHQGVTLVEGRAAYPLFWRLEDEERFREGTVAAHSEPFDQSQIEPPRLIEGRYPVHTGSQGTVEIGIERRMADEFGLEPGDRIVMRVLSESKGSTVETMTGEIVGIVFQPYDYSTLGNLVSPDTLVLADYEDAQRLGGFQGFNSIYARFIDFGVAEEEQSAFTSAVGSTGYIPTFTVIEDPAKNGQIESTRSTSNLLVILAMAALVVSGFLIINVINAIVVEQRRQIGLMKSLGATGADNFYMYAGIAFTYGLIGVVPGVLLGLPAGYLFAQGLALQSQTLIEEFTFSPAGLVLGIVVGLAVPVGAAIVPVLNGIRVGILEAMTDFGISANFGSNRLDRLVGNLPLPISLRQAVRNAYQKKFRLALTGLTLTLAFAAFMGIFAVFSELNSLVENAFDSFGNELTINPNEGQDFESIRNLLVNRVEAVDTVDPASSLSIEIQGFDPPPVQAGPPGLFAQGFNTSNPEILELDLISGDAWNNDPYRDGVVISKSIAEATGKEVGDQVVVLGGGNTQAFEIIGIANSPNDGLWMNWEDLAVFGGLVDSGGRPYPNSFAVSLKGEDLSSRQVDDVITEINETLLSQGISSRFTNQVELAELITTIVTSFGVILSLAALLIALVGAVGLLTTLSMSVFERQKEIGVMRSVGASSWTIAVQFLAEGLIVGLVSWGLSAPLSYLFSRGLIDALPFGGTYELGYPVTALIIGFTGMVIIVTAASLLPSLTAARKTVSDILRYQ